MARANVPLLAFNRGLVADEALARVDLDRTRLSASLMKNWLPKSQGAMRIRPGTKFFGSSLNDTGAVYVEFVAATDDVAMPEITHQKMRIWLGSDAHALALLGRPLVATTLSVSDTGWDNASTGGAIVETVPASDEIPTMTAATTGGVTISAGSEKHPTINPAWKAADDKNSTEWLTATGDTGTWWWKVDFGSSKKIKVHTVRAGDSGTLLTKAPQAWTLQGNDVDTGDGWTTEVSVSGETAWAVSERRTFDDTGYTDTGANAWRYWRLQISAINGSSTPAVAEVEMKLADTTTTAQVLQNAQGLVLNAGAIGALAKATKQVVVDTGDLSVEHSLAIDVSRGPVRFRCGSTAGDDDYISETSLGTGYHNLAFTPGSNFHITIQSDKDIDRIVRNIDIGDTGTVEITAPWDADDLANIRYTQSADVVFVDCKSVRPHKIERRGTGRSWSVVEYSPDDGPFLPGASSSAKFDVSQTYGNTTLTSNIPFFTVGHVGALIRMFHSGQSGVWNLGNWNAATDAVAVTGIGDTGTPSTTSERRIVFDVSGTWAGTIRYERSFDGPDFGFRPISLDVAQSSDTGQTATDTGTVSNVVFHDPDDNTTVWWRARITLYTSGVAQVTITNPNGGVTGRGRITGYNTNKNVDFEVLSRFSDTGQTDNWQQGFWSTELGFPTAVELHNGRLIHAGGANLFASVADDYESFNEDVIGDAGPIIRTLGFGSVDTIHYLVSLLRLVIGTTGAELAMRTSSLNEVLTPDNNSVSRFSTQGSANLRALIMDSNAIFVQRSGERAFEIRFREADVIGGYESNELTVLVPDVLAGGVVSVAIQRQPDTRIHFVLADGTVAILTYEPQEEVLAWSTWVTDTGTSSAVERAMVLPGTTEDAVYYHIRRTINGATKRYLEKWAKEAESQGDTGLSWVADCAASYTDTGRTATLTGFSHVAGQGLIVWADDTGQANAGKDLSPDVAGVQTTYAVDTGAGTITLSEAVHHAVAGLPYFADWRSTKMAYNAEFGTALAQTKRVGTLAFVMKQVHNNAVFFGSDTGDLDPLPRKVDGAQVDADKIFAAFDQMSMPFPGAWDTDSRVFIRAKAPRPVTILAAVPNVDTQEKV